MEPFAQLALARVLLLAEGIAARGAIENALEEVSRLARQMELKALYPFVCLEQIDV